MPAGLWIGFGSAECAAGPTFAGVAATGTMAAAPGDEAAIDSDGNGGACAFWGICGAEVIPPGSACDFDRSLIAAAGDPAV